MYIKMKDKFLEFLLDQCKNNRLLGDRVELFFNTETKNIFFGGPVFFKKIDIFNYKKDIDLLENKEIFTSANVLISIPENFEFKSNFVDYIFSSDEVKILNSDKFGYDDVLYNKIKFKIYRTNVNSILKFQNEIKKKINKISFSKNILYINDYEIDFSGKENQKILIDFIVEKGKLGNEYFFDDIENDFDDINEYIDCEKNNKFRNHWLYNASRDVNNHIKMETGMKDFLITTKKTVKINSEYLDINS